MINREFIHLYMEEIESFDHRQFLSEICQWMEDVENNRSEFEHHEAVLSTLDTVLDIYGECAEMIRFA